jgi:hypothetical protein
LAHRSRAATLCFELSFRLLPATEVRLIFYRELYAIKMLFITQQSVTLTELLLNAKVCKGNREFGSVPTPASRTPISFARKISNRVDWH